ncbi:MAG: PAS domain-containing protein, partial [Pyrinomonadaceae bacterium]
ERKRTQAELNESHRRIEDIVNSVEGIVWEADAHTFEFSFVSTQAEQILGYPSQQWLEEPAFWSEHIHPDDRNEAVEFCIDSRNKLLPHEFEYRMQSKDGREVWIKDTVTVLAENGRAVKLRGIMMDITDRKRSETLLIESQRSLSLATESAKIGIWDWDLVEDTMKWDARMYDLYRNYEEEFSGPSRPWNLNLHPDDADRVYAEYDAVIEGTEDFHSEFRIVWPDGEVRHLESSAKVLRDENGTPLHFIGVNWDITERKQLEDQFRQSQKMEAIGVLAGGIAHDFNNLLTAINGYSDLTLRKMPVDDPLRANIEEVKNAGDRAAVLTSQLLAFSRKQVLNPIVHNVNTVISNIENMLRRIIKENIELRTSLDPNLGNVRADPGQIEQVVMNLTLNARDAMPNGGLLTIKTETTYLEESYVGQHLEIKPGNFVKITVADTGEGISPEVKSHIFDPFFTTKEVGKGTGLGLSTVYGIVKQSGGDIMVYSEVGHGTTFKIYLPCVDENVEQPKWPEPPQEHQRGTGTILLVEDEDIVRNLVIAVLTGAGYKVLDAASGDEGLAICRSYTDPIHLLLSDVIMPKMGGIELKAHVAKLRPEISVLFMSGYTDESLAHRGIYDEDVAFIEKPFTPDALARKVREVLEN